MCEDEWARRTEAHVLQLEKHKLMGMLVRDCTEQVTPLPDALGQRFMNKNPRVFRFFAAHATHTTGSPSFPGQTQKREMGGGGRENTVSTSNRNGTRRNRIGTLLHRRMCGSSASTRTICLHPEKSKRPYSLS